MWEVENNEPSNENCDDNDYNDNNTEFQIQVDNESRSFEIQLPDGWVKQSYQGDTYYEHEDGTTSWDVPVV